MNTGPDSDPKSASSREGGAAKTSVVVIGAGAVGTAVASALRRHGGYRVAAIHSRRRASSERASRAIGEGRVEDDLVSAASEGDVVFITTPDSAIASVADELARGGTFRKKALVVHCSGGLTAEEGLRALAEKGVAIGSIHPLQTFARSREGASKALTGCLVACEGSDATLDSLKRLARDMGGVPFTIAAEKKALYHAAAALASNAVVALVSVAAGVLSRLGLGDERALGAILPLVRGAVANLGSEGLPGALTGPISRGDADVVRRHLERLRDDEPDALRVYVALATETIRVAKRKGSLSPEAKSEIEALVERFAGTPDGEARP